MSQAISTVAGNTFGSGLNMNIVTETRVRKENGETVRVGHSEVNIKTEKNELGHQALRAWLADIRVNSSVIGQLVELGAETVEDLVDLDAEDITSLDLKKLELKRFKAAIELLKE